MLITTDQKLTNAQADCPTSTLTCKWQTAHGAGLYASWRLEPARSARPSSPIESKFQRALARG